MKILSGKSWKTKKHINKHAKKKQVVKVEKYNNS